MFRKLVFQFLASVPGLMLAGAGAAETIAVIGTGNVGSALGQRFAAAGHTVIYGSRTPGAADVQALVQLSGPTASAAGQAEAAQAARVIVLAVPWEVAPALAAGFGDLSGRIIVDPTNPRIIAEDGLRDYAFSDSNAERIQAAAPGAFVVKAFSTLGAHTMLDPSFARSPVSIPLAGDNAAAKEAVGSLATEIGFEPVDVGPLRYAHVIEGLHYLRYNAGVFGSARINYYLPPDPE